MLVQSTTVSHFYKMCGAQDTQHLETLEILMQDYDHPPQDMRTSVCLWLSQLYCQ
jgi:hypothetical protein